jgi:hypothetical protein
MSASQRGLSLRAIWTARFARSAWWARVLAALVLVLGPSLYAAGPAFAYQAGQNQSAGNEALTDCRADGGLAWEYLAFTGYDGQLNLLRYPDSRPFDANPVSTIRLQAYLQQYSIGAPAITCVNEPFGALYIAWTTLSGRIDVGQIVFSHGLYGIVRASIVGIRQLPEATFGDPGLASDDGHNLVLTWSGTDTMHHINVDDINLQTGAVTKYVTTDYTFGGSTVSVAWNGEPARKGDDFTVAFLDANGAPYSGNRPYIFLGRFSPDAPSRFLGSYRTSQYSQFTPSLSPSPGLLTLEINGSGGGRIPQPGGPTEVIWLGFYANQINVGYWSGRDMTGAHGLTLPDNVNDTPGADQCHTAHIDFTGHITYDDYPYFSTCGSA